MRVYILSYFPDALKVTSSCAWATISDKPAPEIIESLNYRKQLKMIRYAKIMRLSSVLDFPYYIISFADVSRCFTHQWVRYRIAAHMQQSLRYVKVNANNYDWFIIPLSILKTQDPTLIASYIKNILEYGKLYLKLVERGIPYEDARFILPIAVKTHISTAMDAEEILHVIYQRTCMDAQWEIRIATLTLYTGLLAVHHEIFSGWGPSCIVDGICRGRGKGKCLSDVKRMLNELEKHSYKIRSMLEEAKNNDIIQYDLTNILGYKVPDKVKEEVYELLGYRVHLDYEVKLYIRKIT